MKLTLLGLTLLLGLVLAGCLEIPTLPVSAPADTATPAAQPTASAAPTVTPEPTALVIADALQVHDAAGIVRDWLRIGDVVTVLGCETDPKKPNYQWCQIKSPPGYVFMGCLDMFNDELGCEAK